MYVILINEIVTSLPTECHHLIHDTEIFQNCEVKHTMSYSTLTDMKTLLFVWCTKPPIVGGDAYNVEAFTMHVSWCHDRE